MIGIAICLLLLFGFQLSLACSSEVSSQAESQAKIGNACTSPELKNHLIESNWDVLKADGKRKAFYAKVSVTANGLHSLVRATGGDTTNRALASEQMDIYDIGVFSRVITPDNPNEWSEWQAYYYTRDQLALRQQNDVSPSDSLLHFCGITDYESVTDEGEKEVNGETTRHYRLTKFHEVGERFAEGSYKIVDFYIAPGGKLIKAEVEERQNYPDETYELSTVIYHLSRFGEQVAIEAPVGHPNRTN